MGINYLIGENTVTVRLVFLYIGEIHAEQLVPTDEECPDEWRMTEIGLLESKQTVLIGGQLQRPGWLKMVMTLCKELVLLIRPSAKRNEKQSLSLVENIPTEMLQHIASFLPTSSAAALALCSHALSRVLGTQYWEKLRETHQEGREDFLSLLERDLPDYIFCQRCAKLHLPDRRGTLDVLLSLEQQRPCFEADMSARTHWYYHDRLRFEHVQIAMKQHRLGLNSSLHVDNQSHTETYEWRSSFAHQVSLKARIVSNSFLICAQDRLLIPAGEVVQSLPPYFPAIICPHLPDLWVNDELSKALLCRLSHLHDQHPCSKCNGLKQCRCCPTEYLWW